MKVKKTKTIIDVTQKELDALKTITNFLNGLKGKHDICASFEETNLYCYTIPELIEELISVADFLDSEKQKEYIINIINEEEEN